jgi:protein involved in polysaccharide export with SLBB domain
MLRTLLLILLLLGRPDALNAQAPESPGLGAGADQVYVLVPGDIVLVRVYQEEDLQTQARIGKDGMITMPLLGAIQIGGRTMDQASGHIGDLLGRDYLVNPQVTVTVLEYAKKRFTVMGHVQRPGTYEFPSEESVNLLQAISMAGGYTRLGAPWKVTVLRLEGGQQRVYKLDADAMSKQKNAKVFEIQADDTITIGEKLF